MYEFIDIFLRKAETSAMIVGDDKLDRPDRSRALYGATRGRKAAWRRVEHNLGPKPGIFLFESAVTH
jgi:hypothetical protein